MSMINFVYLFIEMKIIVYYYSKKKITNIFLYLLKRRMMVNLIKYSYSML